MPSMSSGKGPSNSEIAIQNNTQSMMNTLQQAFSTTFAGQQNILNGLKKSAQNIVAAGPSQFGFSAPELSALNTMVTSQTALGYQQAKAAAGAAAAAAGGGANLPTGAGAATQAALAETAAQQQSNALLGIQEAGYKQGSQNYTQAVGALENVAQQESPTSYSGQALQAGNQAFNEADTIQQQTLAANPWPQVGALAGSLAGAALGMAAPGAEGAIGKIVGKGVSNAQKIGTSLSGLSSGLSLPLNQTPPQTLGNLPSYTPS